MSSWACKKCTFINPPFQKSTCQICLTSSSSSSSSASPSSSPSAPKWACKACTFLNPYRNMNCEVCGTTASVSRFEDLNDTDLDDDESGVGSIFLSLQRCKRKLRDPVVDDEDCVELGGFRGAKGSSKALAVLGEL